jgi:hypothetical protein
MQMPSPASYVGTPAGALTRPLRRWIQRNSHFNKFERMTFP